MVGPLKRYKRDPDGKGRGGGLYYHRGNDEHSKYNPSRDARAGMNRQNARSNPSMKKRNHGHMSDWNLTKIGWI